MSPGQVVLVVDDNPVNVALLEFLLQDAGYTVHAAADAPAALAAITRCPPRLILMDIELPGIDGLTLTRQLKNDPATADILIVAVTSFAMPGDRERALAAGCDGYVSKPIDTRAFVADLARLTAG